MHYLNIYDYLALTRPPMLDGVRAVSREQYHQEVSVGLGTLGRILTHTMISEWYYVLRIEGLEVPPYEQWPIRDEEPPEFEVLEKAWSDQVGRTRAGLGAVRDWDAEIEYPNTDDGVEEIVTAHIHEVAAQLVLHEMYHRSQIRNILRQFGVTIPDTDYNLTVYRRRPA